MIERLPAFGGLVRYGVAPDHQRTKGASAKFLQRLEAAGSDFVFNCEVGRDIDHADLTARLMQCSMPPEWRPVASWTSLARN
jgi:ferredoxin--NADP+ reductase